MQTDIDPVVLQEAMAAALQGSDPQMRALAESLLQQGVVTPPVADPHWFNTPSFATTMPDTQSQILSLQQQLMQLQARVALQETIHSRSSTPHSSPALRLFATTNSQQQPNYAPLDSTPPLPTTVIRDKKTLKSSSSSLHINAPLFVMNEPDLSLPIDLNDSASEKSPVHVSEQFDLRQKLKLEDDYLAHVPAPAVESQVPKVFQSLLGGMTQCALFWDIENCSVPSGMLGVEVARALRHLVHQQHHCLTQITAIGQMDRCSSLLRQQLHDCGIVLQDVCTGKPSAADLTIQTEMMKCAWLHRPPFAIYLVTGDRDFQRMMAFLASSGYDLYLIHPKDGARSLKSFAKQCFVWEEAVHMKRLSELDQVNLIMMDEDDPFQLNQAKQQQPPYEPPHENERNASITQSPTKSKPKMDLRVFDLLVDAMRFVDIQRGNKTASRMKSSELPFYFPLKLVQLSLESIQKMGFPSLLEYAQAAAEAQLVELKTLQSGEHLIALPSRTLVHFGEQSHRSLSIQLFRTLLKAIHSYCQETGETTILESELKRRVPLDREHFDTFHAFTTAAVGRGLCRYMAIRGREDAVLWLICDSFIPLMGTLRSLLNKTQNNTTVSRIQARMHSGDDSWWRHAGFRSFMDFVHLASLFQVIQHTDDPDPVVTVTQSPYATFRHQVLSTNIYSGARDEN